jgi:hypothetical protein
VSFVDFVLSGPKPPSKPKKKKKKKNIKEAAHGSLLTTCDVAGDSDVGEPLVFVVVVVVIEVDDEAAAAALSAASSDIDGVLCRVRIDSTHTHHNTSACTDRDESQSLTWSDTCNVTSERGTITLLHRFAA